VARYDCGIQIKGYNDIEERDVIEATYEGNQKLKEFSIFIKNPEQSGFFLFTVYKYRLVFFESFRSCSAHLVLK
jgi:hypothetical protein